MPVNSGRKWAGNALGVARSLFRKLPMAGLLHGDEFRCACCSSPVRQTGSGLHLCDACHRELAPATQAFCPLCGHLFPSPSEPVHPCGGCMRGSSCAPLRRVIFHGPYKGRMRELIVAFKHGRSLGHLRLFGDMLVQVLERRMEERLPDPTFSSGEILSCTRPDLMLPIPLHPARLRSRGFNQSLEIARRPARVFGIPLASNVLERVRDNRPQTGLDRAERRRNVRSIFRVSPRCVELIEGKNILVVDDVMTTGATLAEAARSLTRAGALHVDGLVLARTPA